VTRDIVHIRFDGSLQRSLSAKCGERTVSHAVAENHDIFHRKMCPFRELGLNLAVLYAVKNYLDAAGQRLAVADKDIGIEEGQRLAVGDELGMCLHIEAVFG